MIDSHAHLAMFDGDERRAVLERAVEAGISRILVPATGPEDLEQVAELALAHPAVVVVALGFHPHEARHFGPEAKRRLQRLLPGPGVVAVGEIGLDYHYDFSSRDEQRHAFAWQLGLARELALPVVLHQREAWEDFLAALDAHPGVRGVAHSFTAGGSAAAEVLRRGLHVGISGMVTFAKADNIREAARVVDEDRLLVETDSPYLAPVPHRGKRNEPAFVRLVAERIASERGVSYEELEAATDANFASLFLRPPG